MTYCMIRLVVTKITMPGVYAFQQPCAPAINLHAQMATVYHQHTSVTATMTALTTVMKLAVVCCLHKKCNISSYVIVPAK